MNRSLVFSMCPKCKALVKVIHGCECDNCGIKCCNEKMITLKPNSSDGAVEKHKPDYKIEGDEVVVTVNHVMEEVHYIEWIAIETEQGIQRKYLKPGDEPKATFSLTEDDTLVAIYEHCNLHGLWKAE